jgi:hypothetical protein
MRIASLGFRISGTLVYLGYTLSAILTKVYHLKKKKKKKRKMANKLWKHGFIIALSMSPQLHGK